MISHGAVVLVDRSEGLVVVDDGGTSVKTVVERVAAGVVDVDGSVRVVVEVGGLVC